jgi:hypothetical protein
MVYGAAMLITVLTAFFIHPYPVILPRKVYEQGIHRRLYIMQPLFIFFFYKCLAHLFYVDVEKTVPLIELHGYIPGKSNRRGAKTRRFALRLCVSAVISFNFLIFSLTGMVFVRIIPEYLSIVYTVLEAEGHRTRTWLAKTFSFFLFTAVKRLENCFMKPYTYFFTKTTSYEKHYYELALHRYTSCNSTGQTGQKELGQRPLEKNERL